MSQYESKSSKAVLDCLEQIFKSETAGIIRYLHYSFMIMGHHRIPIQKWFRDQATESMDHAVVIGEKITAYGGHPPLVTDKVPDTKSHEVNTILKESLEFELEALELYKKLASIAGDDIALEEMARDFVRTETEQVEEVMKMLRSNK
ncbi:MAG: ferritin-like domain-containing protein [Oligoflexia bacterium]|nr:ferritin-like domain-containing protein [Oligoflexia bacterium]